MITTEENLISPEASGRQALAKLELTAGGKTLFVVSGDGFLLGTLTDGDIRRGLIKGLDIDGSVTTFMYRGFKYLIKDEYTIKDIEFLRLEEIALVPLLTQDKRLIKIIDLSHRRSYIPCEAVIMAGGRGERLRPMTDLVPKPLLKVGGRPIIEYNIDQLINYGVEHIHISVHYLGDLLKDYFKDGSSKGIRIDYIDEDKPIGTFGAVGLVPEFSKDYVLVMNSDLLTNIDFEDFFRTFVQSGADMTLASIPYHVNIPYAVLELENETIRSFKEKPTYTYYSNGGIYLIKKELLKYIPKEEVFNATDLMELLIAKGRKVSSYPHLGYWLDIGQPADFAKAQEDIKHIKF
ncbi:nucleotidyltransferase family protein [Rufibacter soli]